MRQYPIENLSSVPVERNRLIALVREVVEPDAIYLLATCYHKRRMESIYCIKSPESEQISEYWLLVLVSETKNRSIAQLQEQIEQHCHPEIAVTAIALEADIFNKWLDTGHPFTRTICSSAIPLIETPIQSLRQGGGYNAEADLTMLEKQFREGLNKSQEFLAGADLFRIRKQHKLAAFMLHQATEQALGTLLKIATGYYCCTHNLERLLRYACMVSYQLFDVFPRKTDNDKKLFKLLQRAYIESRYREEYHIGDVELLELIDKIRWIQNILKETANRFIQERRA